MKTRPTGLDSQQWGLCFELSRSMMKTLISLFMLLVISRSTWAQIVVSGYVTDKSNGESMIGAAVVDTSAKYGTTSNSYGFFSLSLTPGRKIISVSYPGYLEWIIDTVLLSNVVLRVELISEKALDQVTIRARPGANIAARTQMSMIDLPLQQVRKLPALLGEVDVIKAIQLLPGVKGGNEGSSGLYVRGGGPDQNLIMLDGIQLYNVQHMFGFFSVFNADAINSIQLYKGGFPARYGGRLSSVLDISMKEGNNQRHEGNFSISPIAFKLALNGPLSKSGKTTYAVSLRRSIFDLLIGRSTRDGSNQFYYNFYDFNGKVSHRISDKERIYLSFYSGRDKFYTKAIFEDNSNNRQNREELEGSLIWGNTCGSVRYNRIHNPRLFANHTLGFTSYRYKNSIEFDASYRTDTSFEALNIFLGYGAGITDLVARSDFEYSHSASRKYRFGVEGIYHHFRPGNFELRINATGGPFIDTVLGPKNPFNSQEVAAYGEADYNLGRGLQLNTGLRLANYLTASSYRFFPEPRVSLRQRLANDMSVKFSYAMMNQSIHLLTNSSGGLPWDLWFPATARIRPQRSQQLALGLAQSWKYGIEFSLESYFKWMNHLVDYAEGADLFAVQTDWEDKVKIGTGRMYGSELLLQRKAGKLNGWLGYTLSWSDRMIPDINFGKRYYFRWDRRHHLSAVAMYKLDDVWEISSTFLLQSGNAITLPQGRYLSVDGTIINDYVAKNDFRMPLYHRLDFSLTKRIKPHNNLTPTKQYWSLTVYNVYNRFNPFYIEIDNTRTPPRVVGVAFFRFLPVLTYSMKF
jgi:hypothetical protein